MSLENKRVEDVEQTLSLPSILFVTHSRLYKGQGTDYLGKDLDYAEILVACDGVFRFTRNENVWNKIIVKKNNCG